MSSSLYAILKLFKTTSPQNCSDLIASHCTGWCGGRVYEVHRDAEPGGEEERDRYQPVRRDEEEGQPRYSAHWWQQGKQTTVGQCALTSDTLPEIRHSRFAHLML